MTAQVTEAIHTNLLLLEFDEFIRKESKSKNMSFMRDVSNTPYLFMGNDKLPFQVVTYFLLNKLTPLGQTYADGLKKLKSCFPCMDKRMESDFRKVTAGFLSTLEKDTDFRLQKKLPFATVLMYPGKEAFLNLYLKFTNFVVTKLCPSNGRMIIRSHKAHNPANLLIRPQVATIIQSQKNDDTVRLQLKLVAAEYEKMLTQYSRERDLNKDATGEADAEMKSVFSQQNETEDTCFAYVNQVIDLLNRPPLTVPDLTPLLAALVRDNERKALVKRCSEIDAVTRMKMMSDLAKQVSDQLRKVSNSSIMSLCTKNATPGSFVGLTDADVDVIQQELRIMASKMSQSSHAIRQSALNSEDFAAEKRRIASIIGLNHWINQDIHPIAVPMDGVRKWREREKQRQAVRRLEVVAPSIQSNVNTISSPEQTMMCGNDSLANFSLVDTSMRLSIEMSMNVPDFILDTTV